MLNIADHNKSITAYYWLIHESYTILYKMSRQLIKLKTVQNMIEDTLNSNFSSQPKYKHASLDRNARERSVTTSLSRWWWMCWWIEAAAAAASMSKDAAAVNWSRCVGSGGRPRWLMIQEAWRDCAL